MVSNPIEYWESISYGKKMPENFTCELGNKLRMEDADDETKKAVLQKHPYVWGKDYWSMKLNNNDLSITVASLLGFNKTLVKIEGLEGPDPNNSNVVYHWQYGLTQVIDYMFYTRLGLQSAYEVLHSITKKEVRFYFYDPNEAKGKSAEVAKLKKKSGREYYVLFVHNPSTLGDVAGLLHEFGHIVGEEKKSEEYEKRYKELEEDQDWILAVNKFNNGLERLEDEACEEKYKELYKEFYFSVGFLKRQNIEMKVELDAWNYAIEIINKIGLSGALNPESEEFKENMYFCIKSRIPSNFYND